MDALKGLIAGLIVGALFSPICQAYQSYSLPHSLGEVKVNSNPESTEIFFQIPSEVGYVVRELTHPPRIMLNLYPVNMKLPNEEITVEDRFVEKIRLARDSENVAKMVLDLATSRYSFDISSRKSPNALVIEIRPPREDLIMALLNKEEDSSREGVEALFADKEFPLPEKQKGIYRIIIDPGHGGKDPGAIGPSGLKEKKVTLEVARKLSKMFKENLPFVEVFLTRDRDEFVSLDRRAEIANQLKGDLFVSVHVNSAWDRTAKGVETFYNSQYVYGEEAEKVAMRENAAFASQENVPFKVKNIIWDLIQNQHRTESKNLSEVIQKNLVEVCDALNRGVKSARFYVLRGVNMPAVLVEIGFISNPLQERELRNERFQERAALGLFKGLANYIESFNEKVMG